MLNYRRMGTGEALVLVHGFLGGGGYWGAVAEHFARRFQVILPDLPGFAGSAALPVPETVAGFAAALIEFMDGLGIERCRLMGHSMGGMIVQQVALDAPSRISRLILYGTACQSGLPERFETVEETIARIAAEGIEATADRIVATWFVDGEKSPAYAPCRAAGDGALASSAVAAMRTMQGWSARDRLGEIAAPTLAIGGDRDRSIAPHHLLDLWRGIPDCRLAVVPGCAHAVHLEKPVLFMDLVDDFLATGGRGGPV